MTKGCPDSGPPWWKAVNDHRQRLGVRKVASGPTRCLCPFCYSDRWNRDLRFYVPLIFQWRHVSLPPSLSCPLLFAHRGRHTDASALYSHSQPSPFALHTFQSSQLLAVATLCASKQVRESFSSFPFSLFPFSLVSLLQSEATKSNRLAAFTKRSD